MQYKIVTNFAIVARIYTHADSNNPTNLVYIQTMVWLDGIRFSNINIGPMNEWLIETDLNKDETKNNKMDKITNKSNYSI